MDDPQAIKSYSAPYYSLDTEVSDTRRWVRELVVGVLYSPGDTHIFTDLQELVNAVDSLTPNQVLIIHNAAFDLGVIGLTPKCQVFDTLAASWLLDENESHRLKDLAPKYLGTTLEDPCNIKDQEVFYKSKQGNVPIIETPIDEVTAYCLADAIAAYDLFWEFAPALEAVGLKEWAYSVEFPTAVAVAELEAEGLVVDKEKLEEVTQTLSTDLEFTKDYLDGLVRIPLNYNSPKQLREYLFSKDVVRVERGQVGELKTCVHGKAPEKCCKKPRPKYGPVERKYKGLNLKTPPKKTTSGEVSTDVSTLQLYAGNEIIDTLLDYRELDKLVNTYLTSWPRYMDDNLLYGHFNPFGTDSGRFSHSEPNLGNIPARGENGALLRSMFVAPPGYKLIVADLAGIELRLIAEFSQEPTLLEAFKEGIDPHLATAIKLFNNPKLTKGDKERGLAKNINYALSYGAGPKKIAEMAAKDGWDLSTGEVKDFLKRYYEVLPRVPEWKEEVLDFARRNGYVQLLSGRRRRLPDINHYDQAKRSYAERVAINVLPQGTTADIMKIAMVNSHRAGLTWCSQVHDEALVLTSADQAEFKARQLEEFMKGAGEHLGIKIPIEVEAKLVHRWSEK